MRRATTEGAQKENGQGVRRASPRETNGLCLKAPAITKVLAKTAVEGEDALAPICGTALAMPFEEVMALLAITNGGSPSGRGPTQGSREVTTTEVVVICGLLATTEGSPTRRPTTNGMDAAMAFLASGRPILKTNRTAGLKKGTAVSIVALAGREKALAGSQVPVKSGLPKGILRNGGVSAAAILASMGLADGRILRRSYRRGTPASTVSGGSVVPLP